MSDGINEQPKEPVEPAQDQLFNQLAEIQPLRELPPDLEGEEIDEPQGHKGITKREKENPNLTDLQAFDKRLYPDLEHLHLNATMVSRIFPDIYNPLMRILVKDLLKRDEKMSVAEAISLVNTAQSIAIDGEGRIDLLGLAGVSHAESQAKESNKGLV